MEHRLSQPPPEVLSRYHHNQFQGRIQALPGGNINSSFLISTGPHSFVLQRIAQNVFSSPAHVVENSLLVSEHLRARVGCDLKPVSVSEPWPTLDGAMGCSDDSGGYWRALRYIPNTPHHTVPVFYEGIGRLLAGFHALMADFDPSALHTVLPGFHDLNHYLERFDGLTASVAVNSENTTIRGSGQRLDRCIKVVAGHRKAAEHFVGLVADGLIPLQAVHGDPKIENFLFNEEGFPIGLIDLDTVGRGTIFHDIGDCLRSCCNPSGESGTEPCFDLQICSEIISGYLKVAGDGMAPILRRYIFDGVRTITFELGVRFLTDFLEGNPYFVVSYPEENLDRAIGQLSLLQSIIEQETAILNLLV